MNGLLVRVIGESNSNWWPLIGIIAPHWWLGQIVHRLWDPSNTGWNIFTQMGNYLTIAKLWQDIQDKLEFLFQVINFSLLFYKLHSGYMGRVCSLYMSPEEDKDGVPLEERGSTLVYASWLLCSGEHDHSDKDDGNDFNILGDYYNSFSSQHSWYFFPVQCLIDAI